MSLRAYCPACDSETSSIRAGFLEEGQCPYCGLSADVAGQLAAARVRGADQHLIGQTAKAERRAELAEGRVRELLAGLHRVERDVAETLNALRLSQDPLTGKPGSE